MGRLQQSIALLPKNCLEQSPDRSTSDAPITRAPTLRDFSLLRCLGTGGYAEVWLAPYISLYLPISPYISLYLPYISEAGFYQDGAAAVAWLKEQQQAPA